MPLSSSDFDIAIESNAPVQLATTLVKPSTDEIVLALQPLLHRITGLRSSVLFEVSRLFYIRWKKQLTTPTDDCLGPGSLSCCWVCSSCSLWTLRLVSVSGIGWPAVDTLLLDIVPRA